MTSLSIERISIRPVLLPLAAPRTISRETSTHANLIEVTVAGALCEGVGQAGPTPHWGESVVQALNDFERMQPELKRLENRSQLQEVVPAGALRNAIDCALWDLEAKQSKRSVEDICGTSTKPITTAFTISLDTPEAVGQLAERERDRPLIKIKLGRFADDAARLRSVRKNAPDARLIVDANEGWNIDQLKAMAPVLAEARVEMIEQPLKVKDDEMLRGIALPSPLCADELCHTRGHLPRLEGLYNFINIKLDKTGGLTEALALAHEAQERGFGIMVGCTWGTTLGMAPAFLIAQLCKYSDLDAPLFLAQQEREQLVYDGSTVNFARTRTWGI